MRARIAAALGAFAWAAACAAPPPPPPPPEPEPVAPAPATAAKPAAATASVRLPNGLAVAVTEARAGEAAQLHLAFLVGSTFVAPGLAELALEAFVEGADASRGRPSLRTAVAALGGTVDVSVGPLTSWVQIRVPPARWRAAQEALLRALDAPPATRSQLERVRDELVDRRAAAIARDPMRATAEAMLLAEPDPAARVTALLDRDVSEIGLFQARLHRPERALFALLVPGDPALVAESIQKGTAGTLGTWKPAAVPAPEPRLLARTFAEGLHWSPDPKRGCEVAWLQFLPSLDRVDAASVYAMHACWTLDGAGGRLERLQRDRGLGHVRWRSEFVHGADTVAVLLRANVTAAEVPLLAQVVEAARRSLRDVPPNASELELARRRAALTAGLGMSDAVTRRRTEVRLAVVGGSIDAFERRLAVLAEPGGFDAERAAAGYLDLPAMMLVIGGEVPAGLAEAKLFELLPAGLAPALADDPARQHVSAAPWIERASDAIGGAHLLRRLTGCRYEARLTSPHAPPAEDTVAWRNDGTVNRVREVLGERIETRLEGTNWTEVMGTDLQNLSAREATLLRREFERHPLALLAAAVTGRLEFATVAQRNVGDRDYMVLQAIGDRWDRLRVHVDTVSHLVRLVEVWETAPDGTVVHLEDAWSDYRTSEGLRVPFRRVTTIDDGQNSVETVFADWRPVFSAP